MPSTFLIAFPLLIVSLRVFPDTPSFNRPYVSSSSDGSCYLKAVPAGPDGVRGTTKIFRVERGADAELLSFNWYSRRTFIFCGVNVGGNLKTVVVRFTPSHSGHIASERDAAFEIFHDKRKVSTISTLALAETSDNVLQTFSHYFSTQSVQPVFSDGVPSIEVVTNDGRTLRLDLISGKIE